MGRGVRINQKGVDKLNVDVENPGFSVNRDVDSLFPLMLFNNILLNSTLVYSLYGYEPESRQKNEEKNRCGIQSPCLW
jgi:hypothetical protein